jgi:hypothetical protein
MYVTAVYMSQNKYVIHCISTITMPNKQFIFIRNGDRYEGMWVNDVRDGRGILYCTDGSVYEVNMSVLFRKIVL